MSQTSIILLYIWSKHPSYTGHNEINTESHSADYLKRFYYVIQAPVGRAVSEGHSNCILKDAQCISTSSKNICHISLYLSKAKHTDFASSKANHTKWFNQSNYFIFHKSITRRTPYGYRNGRKMYKFRSDLYNFQCHTLYKKQLI
jgi:hypothetical protein